MLAVARSHTLNEGDAFGPGKARIMVAEQGIHFAAQIVEGSRAPGPGSEERVTSHVRPPSDAWRGGPPDGAIR
jgi:hypothetical protein